MSGAGICNSPTALAAQDDARHVVALWLLSKGELDQAAVGAVNDAVGEIAGLHAGSLLVLDTPAIQERLGREPLAALGECGAELACIAKLGVMASAHEVLVVRAMPPKDDGGGIVLQYLVVATDAGVLARKGRIDLPGGGAAEVLRLLSEHTADLFGLTEGGDRASATTDESSTDGAGQGPQAGTGDDSEQENILAMQRQVAALEAVLADAESKVQTIELKVRNMGTDVPPGTAPGDGGDVSATSSPILSPTPDGLRGGISDSRLYASTSLAAVGTVAIVGGLISKGSANSARARDPNAIVKTRRRRGDAALAAGIAVLTSVGILLVVDWLAD